MNNTSIAVDIAGQEIFYLPIQCEMFTFPQHLDR